jgi:hypothetical protein
MRLAMLVIVCLCIGGCGGTVTFQSRRDAPASQTVPVPKKSCCDISQRQAAEIAAAEAAARDCSHLQVVSVKRDDKRWKVEMVGHCSDGRDGKIRVKVDAFTGQIVQYKAKLDKRSCSVH